MEGEPLHPDAAKKLARQIMATGQVVWPEHVWEEMAKDGLTTQDGINTIRAGAYQPAEYVKREWRYKSQTQRMSFVITFRSQNEMRVVTAWRHRR